MTKIKGTNVADLLVGGAEEDQLYGLGGDDVLIGGALRDRIDGGAGVDTVSYADHDDRIFLRLYRQNGRTTTETAFPENEDDLFNIENIVGSAFADFIVGDAKANKIFGGAGNDLLASSGFDSDRGIAIGDKGLVVDTLDGGDGNDRIFGGYRDHLNGGSGYDALELNFSALNQAVTLDLTAAFSGGTSNVGGGLITGFEEIGGFVGTRFSDTIVTGEADQFVPDYVRFEDDESDRAALLFFGVRGGAGRDTITGGSRTNYLRGEGDADRIFGLGGDDYLTGGTGADFIDGGEGNDVLVAGEEIFSFLAHFRGFLTNLSGLQFSGLVDVSVGDVINGGAGYDLIVAGFGDKIDGGLDLATVQIYAAGSAPSITGTVIQNVDSVTINLDDSDNVIDVSNAQISGQARDAGSQLVGIFGRGGNDVVTGGFPGGVYIAGEAGDDVLTGGAGNDVLLGGDGGDHLLGMSGDDFLSVGFWDGSGSGDSIDGGDGIDTVSYASVTYWQRGEFFDEGAASGVAVDLALDGAQDTSGAGINTLVSIENVVGTEFFDTISGDDRDNVIAGGGTPYNSPGSELLEGRGGDDVFLDAVSDGVRFDGGDGIDTVAYESGGFTQPSGLVGVSVNLMLTDAQNIAPAGNGFPYTQTFVSIENLVGTDYADQLRGNASANVLRGRGGDDVLFAVGGDHLLGDEGDDRLVASNGADVLDGGYGIDTADFSKTLSIIVDLSLGKSQQAGPVDLLVSIENVAGSIYGDTIKGDDGVNVLEGGLGADVLSGLGGDDRLVGGKGSDRLSGGAGSDRLIGGADADTFVFYAATESDGVSSLDVIADFRRAEGDKVGLVAIDAVAGTSANDAFSFVGAFDGRAGQLTSIFDSLTGIATVYGDVNGDGSADFQIQVMTQSALTSGDFFL